MARPEYGHARQVARAELLEARPWCEYCGQPANVADHQPPLSLHAHVEGSGCCILVPSSTDCAARSLST